MSNPFQSLVKAIQVPSEIFETECKKNTDIFLKTLKKKKRLIVSKLKKNEITKEQASRYFENICDYLTKEKQKRLEEIVSVTESLFGQSEDELESSFHSKKRILIEEIDENQSQIDEINEDKENATHGPPKRQRLSISPLKELDLETEIDDSIEIITINATKSTKPIDIIEEEDAQTTDANQTIVPDDNINRKTKIIEKITKTINIDSIKSQNPPENTPLMIAGKKATNKSQISQPGSLANGKKAPLSIKNKINNANSNIQSELKTPQTGTLYKSRFYREVSASARTKSTSKQSDKSITSTNTVNQSQINTSAGTGTVGGSANKKTAADIRRQQEKAEQDRLAKMKERAEKRQENQRKLDQMRMIRQPNVASTTKKTAITKVNQPQPQPKIDRLPTTTLTATKLLSTVNNNSTTTTTTTTTTTSSTSNNKVINKTQKSIEKTPMINKSTNHSAITTHNQTQLSTATIAVSDLCQTPFSKKRVSILSDSCRKLIASHDNFSIEDLIDLLSDEDAEEEYQELCRRKQIPRWCDKSNGTMMNLLRYQTRHLEPEFVFRPAALVPIDVRRVFGEDAEVRDDCLEEWPEV